MIRVLHVKKRHINKGKPNSTCSCPIALALRDRLGLTKEQVRVEGSFAAVRLNRNWIELNLGGKAERFVWNFDDGKNVSPTTLTVKLEEAY